jgi:phage terminase large subunit GpA-like protein
MNSDTALVTDIASQMRTQEVRTIEQFAQDEIVLPDGPFAGERLDLQRSPALKLFCREFDTGRWERHFWTGPNQDGKSLLLVLVLMYLLFERRQTVVFGVPNLDIVEDKWRLGMLPIIKGSRYVSQLPASGAGSKEGSAVLLQFRCGSALRFMTGGGGDETRAGLASPNLVVTETEAFDEVGSSSREGDKFSQLERRLLSWGNEARTFGESTVSIEKGRIWREYTGGSQSRIALPCPHCRTWVTPEREHFHGWQGADSELAAAEGAALHCPSCGAAWTNDERIAANHHAVLVHAGQAVDAAGNVTGPLPRTNTFSFRWTCINSIMRPERMAKVAIKEWKAKRVADEEIAEKELQQSEWVIPHAPDATDLSKLEWQDLTHRMSPDPPRRVPSDTDVLVFAADVGKRLIHWVCLAQLVDGSRRVVEYGRKEVAADELGEEVALKIALRDLRDSIVEKGWESDSGPRVPDQKLIDSGKWTDLIYKFCRESGPTWIPCKGFGEEQRGRYDQRPGRYSEPRELSDAVAIIGDGYYLARLFKRRIKLCHINADRWKSWVHACLKMKATDAGALTLFQAKPETHISIAKHWTAERNEEQFIPGTGNVTKWYVVHRNNHWLDATAIAGVAADLAIIIRSKKQKRRPSSPPAAVTPAQPPAAEDPQDVQEEPIAPPRKQPGSSKWRTNGGNRWSS